MNDLFRRLYLARFGSAPTSEAPLSGDGSKRDMTRIVGPAGSAIGVLGPDREENRAFLSFSRAFRGIGLPVPEIYGADEAAGAYLVEDLGDTTLFQALSAARRAEPRPFPASMLPVYRRVLETLPRFQVEGGRVVDYAVAYPRAAFDRPSMLWDLNYFKYHFVKLSHVSFNEDRLERDFERLTDVLLAADASHFLYRDFQSRNVMLRDGEPWFIDYQGGRRGALPYDVASLLYDAKAEIPPAVRDDLLEHYLEALSRHVPVDPAQFREQYKGFVLVRILQAMGAYGYRGFYERKPHFLASVPPAVRNVRHLLATDAFPADLPEIRAVFERIAADPSLSGAPGPSGQAPAARGLTVHVGSFSYARGAPDDPGQNGGGFVFDCRALDNPGRLEAFSARSGLDPDVIAFLEARPETHAFFAHAKALVLAQAAAYVARGFTSLQALFGCTGGQHRSVYLAERLGRELAAAMPGIEVRVAHAERDRWPVAVPAARSATPTRA